MTLSKENADKTWTIIAEYYYIRNAQGDIIGLFDKTGAQVVSYLYDSWGKLISINGTLASTVGVKNPYRYRGYRYDIETGLYYLQSRYYNPEWGRFIKTDALVGQNGQLLNHNMFAYCANSPVTIKATSGFAHRLAAEDGGTYVPFDNGKIVPYESVAKKLSKDYTVITTVLI
jgi:RHS repeat-associated protein